MALKDDLTTEVGRIFRGEWEVRDGQVVPQPTDLALAKNEAVKFDRATVLYADLSGSTAMVDGKKWWFAAEVYQSYLYCVGRIIRNDGGTIVAYDGDRAMAIFIGDSQSTNAAKCALHINYVIKDIINPAISKQYGASVYEVKQVVGIDTSPIHAVRTGVRGGSDIVWVGRAANYAAKLTELNLGPPTWITGKVFERMANSSKYRSKDNTLMWKQWKWNQNNEMQIFSSNWTWPF